MRLLGTERLIETERLSFQPQYNQQKKPVPLPTSHDSDHPERTGKAVYCSFSTDYAFILSNFYKLVRSLETVLLIETVPIRGKIQYKL